MMFNRLLLGTTLVTVWVGVASAQVSVTSEAGAWKTIAGVANDGTTLCGAEVSGRDRIFMVKWFDGNDELFIQIAKIGWSIPDGQPVDVALQFDHLAPWRVKASGIQATPVTGSMIQFRIEGDNITAFMNELRFASHMSVVFPTGSEQPWSGSLKGSNVAVINMMQCVHSVLASHTSQPFVAAPAQPRPEASQPFTAPSAPMARPSPPIAPFNSPQMPGYSPRSVESEI